MVPDGWEQHPIGDFLTESRIPGSDGLTAHKITVKLYGKGVYAKDEKRLGSASTKYYKRQVGQFIYSKLDFLNGAFGIIPEELDGYESTLDLPTFDFSPQINAQWLLSYVAREIFYRAHIGLAKGGRKARRVSPSEFLSIEIPFPPLSEQKKIAVILSSVDDAIKATQVVIDQSRRVKQGLLQQLLTRGIGHTRFKQTEIGEIPDEWETGFLKRFCEQICVGFVGTCEKYYRNTGIPMVRTGNLKEGFLDSSKMKYVTHDFHQKQKKSQLKPGDLLIARHGNSGQACLVPESLSEANCLNVVIVRVNKDCFNPLFLQYIFNSNLIKQSIVSKSAGSTQTVINTSEIARTLFPKPSLNEQIEIAEIIKTVDHSIDLENDKLHSLYTIKRGLMQDLLTGRVRVKLDGEAIT